MEEFVCALCASILIPGAVDQPEGEKVFKAGDQARHIYVTLRLSAVRDEVKQLSDDRTTVQTALKSVVDRKSAEFRALRRRLHYAQGRIPEARAEIEALLQEKNAAAAPSSEHNTSANA